MINKIITCGSRKQDSVTVYDTGCLTITDTRHGIDKQFYQIQLTAETALDLADSLIQYAKQEANKKNT